MPASSKRLRRKALLVLSQPAVSRLSQARHLARAEMFVKARIRNPGKYLNSKQLPRAHGQG